jgi:hypothetical protein
MNLRCLVALAPISVCILQSCTSAVAALPESVASDGGASDGRAMGDANLRADSNDTSVDSGDMTCGLARPVVAPPSCDVCAKTKCCEELRACIVAADCVRLNNAVASCQQKDAGEVAECVTMARANLSAGVAAFDAFFGTCLPKSCKSECVR